MIRLWRSRKTGDKNTGVTVWNRVTRILKRLGIGLVGLLVLFFLLNWIFPVPDKIEYSTIITDNKGEVVNAYLTKDQQWRMKTELDEISQLLQKTIVAKEDRHFYSHPGVNPFAVIRAFSVIFFICEECLVPAPSRCR